MRFVLLLIAAVVAVIAGVVALQMSSKPSTPVAQNTTAPQTASLTGSVSTVDVLVAKNFIPVGSVITAEMLDKQPWPENLLVEGFVVSGRGDNIVGKVARAAFQAREPLLASKLANPNDPSFLAAGLPSGMRAVTIATDAVAGVAGFVFAGDRVDVLLTHNVPSEVQEEDQRKQNLPAAGGGSKKPGYTEVLAGNVRVLAVNVRDAGTGKENPAAISPSSMTLEVSEQQAQQLRLAEKLGTLSLSLRSLKDKDNNELPDPTAVTQLTRVHVESQGGDSIRIVRGVGKDSDASGGLAKALSGIFAPKPTNANQ